MTYARPIPDPDTTYHCYYCHWQGTGAEYRAQILDRKLSGCCDTPWLEPCRILTPPPMEGSRAAAPHPPSLGTPSSSSVPPAEPITLADLPDLLEEIENKSSCSPASPERIPPILEDEDLSEAEKLDAIIYELEDDIRCINAEAHDTVCELEALRDGLIARLNTLMEDPADE